MTVVLPTSTPQIIAPFALGASFSGVLISITPGIPHEGRDLDETSVSHGGVLASPGQPLLSRPLCN